MSPRILFILKKRSVYGINTRTKNYGLSNSCSFVTKELSSRGIHTHTVQVIDNNCIDREVTKFKPTHCIIEALWVTPEKFITLSILHPKVEWIIRLHSEISFLATEGIAIDWIREYNRLKNAYGIKISIASNSLECIRHLSNIIPIKYAPNIYFPPNHIPERLDSALRSDEIHIGCFGALRPLKNHLQQALWAIEFSKTENKELYFHINSSEHEVKESESVLKNLRSLFVNKTGCHLVEHLWTDHLEFIKLVSTMDLGMQISFSETFNIVAADFVHCGVPIVVSDEIDWIFPFIKADPFDTDHVLFKMKFAYYGNRLNFQYLNKIWLNYYNKRAINEWLKFIGKK